MELPGQRERLVHESKDTAVSNIGRMVDPSAIRDNLPPQ